MVDKYFISSASMDKLYKVKLLSCFRNKHFANKKEAYCAIVFAGLTNDSGAQEISEQESIWETSLTYKKLPRAPRGPARWETTPRKLGLVLINPEHIYRHDCTALCRRSDAIIILTFQMQKTAAQKVWWPRVPSKLNATATKLSPQTCAAVTAVATGGTGAAGAALQLHPPRGWDGVFCSSKSKQVQGASVEWLGKNIGGREAGGGWRVEYVGVCRPFKNFGFFSECFGKPFKSLEQLVTLHNMINVSVGSFCLPSREKYVDGGYGLW